jgi:hypothetical protein
MLAGVGSDGDILCISVQVATTWPTQGSGNYHDVTQHTRLSVRSGVSQGRCACPVSPFRYLVGLLLHTAPCLLSLEASGFWKHPKLSILTLIKTSNVGRYYTLFLCRLPHRIWWIEDLEVASRRYSRTKIGYPISFAPSPSLKHELDMGKEEVVQNVIYGESSFSMPANCGRIG